MCGIVGVASLKGPIDKERLFSSLSALRERGPDDLGTWFSTNGNVALGHRRLSIIDLPTGKQPICNEEESVWVVTNGEFYGYESIRNALEKRGHVFRTKSDAEIVVHLYEEYGSKCVDSLRGEFAFILWDGANEELYAFRDRFGIKPLCYSFSRGQLFIASKAKALFPLGLEARWDPDALYHALSHQYVPPTKTLFSKIDQLPPGHCLHYKNGELIVEKYWDWNLPQNKSLPMDLDEAIYRVGQGLDEAVRLRLRADVPVAFHLSGGLDSSSVVCSAKRAGLTNPTCFTVAFKHGHYNELPIASEFAAHVGGSLIAVEVSSEDLVSVLPDAVFHSEGLAINGHLPAKYLLSRCVHEAGFKVVLTGEGADEVFLGYPHFKLDSGIVALEDVNASNPEAVGVMLPAGVELSTESVAAKLGFVPAFMRAKAAIGFQLHQLLNKSFKNRFNNQCVFEKLMNYFPVGEQLKNRAIELQSSYIWSKLALANYILSTLGDGTEMAHSVEGRLPFLDHILFDTIKAIPINLKIGQKIEKAILRRTYDTELTETIRKRRKQPFLAPPLLISHNERTLGFLTDVLATEKVPFFDDRRIQSLLERAKTLSPKELVTLDPVLMTILSTALIQYRFGLS